MQPTEIAALAKQLKGVMATLPLGVRARAEEHARPDRLFADPTAVEWLRYLPWPAALSTFYDWRFQTGFAVRTRVLDDAVERFLARTDRPVVVELGAGLSTRHARLGRERATWIALDLPVAVADRLTPSAGAPRAHQLTASGTMQRQGDPGSAARRAHLVRWRERRCRSSA